MSDRGLKARNDPETAEPSREALDRFTRDLAHYAQVDWTSQASRLNEAMGDLFIRLDEFQHLLDLSQADTSTCLFRNMPKVAEKYEAMEPVFDQIDRLEIMVAKVKENMDSMDKSLSRAEQTVEGSGIRTYMPKFFGAAGRPMSVVAQLTEQPEAVQVFSTEDFFSKKTD